MHATANQAPWSPERINEQTRRFYEAYTRQAAEIRARHAAQGTADAAALRQKYQQPVFGEIPTWSLFEMMGQIIDPADEQLYCTSQSTHILQVIDALTADGMANEEFILAALLHDVGKVALLRNDPATVATYTCGVLAVGEPGAGLEHCTLQWSCDDLAWSRLKDHLPPAVSWLIRYHSIAPKMLAPYMNAQDRDFAEHFLAPFRICDIYSKSPFARPRTRLEDYRPLIEKHLPPRIVF